MIRTQIQLTEEQATALKKLAAERDISMAELIRQAVDRVIADADRRVKRQRALEVLGSFDSGLSDIARNHDKYLDVAYSH